MREISRRGFLKGVAALGAMTAATGMATSPLVASAEDAPKGNVEVKHMWCQMCGVSVGADAATLRADRQQAMIIL